MAFLIGSGIILPIAKNNIRADGPPGGPPAKRSKWPLLKNDARYERRQRCYHSNLIKTNRCSVRCQAPSS